MISPWSLAKYTAQSAVAYDRAVRIESELLSLEAKRLELLRDLKVTKKNAEDSLQWARGQSEADYADLTREWDFLKPVEVCNRI